MQPRNVTIDTAGNLYISDFEANQVYNVGTNGTLTLVAGTGVAGLSGDGMGALIAQLNAPAGLAVDATGSLYVADSGNNRVRKVSSGVIITVFNTPSPTGLALDSTGTLYIAASSYFGTLSQQNPSITSAIDVAVDGLGDLFATNATNLVEIPANGTLTTIAGGGATLDFGGDNGPATSAQLNSPTSVAMDSSGNWYVADTANNRIRKVTPADVISTIAGTGAAGLTGDNGPAVKAQLNAPRGMAFDIFGNLLFADSGNHEVRKITPAGLIQPVATQLNKPVSVATDAQGSIYIADSGNNQVIKVTSDGASSTLATQIVQPQALAVDVSGNVMVADASQIWTVTPAGVATTLVMGLHAPTGIAFAPDGSLLITDTGANVIRQWTTSGSLNTIAGTGAAGFAGDGGAALSAQLNGPAGVGVGSNGTFWIADCGQQSDPIAYAVHGRSGNYDRVPRGGQRGQPYWRTDRAGRNRYSFWHRLQRYPDATSVRRHCSDSVLHQRHANQRARPGQFAGEFQRYGERSGEWNGGGRIADGRCQRGAGHFHRRQRNGRSGSQQSGWEPEFRIEPSAARVDRFVLRHWRRIEYGSGHFDCRRLSGSSVVRGSSTRLPRIDADQRADPRRLPRARHSAGSARDRRRVEPSWSNDCDSINGDA